MMVKFKAKKLDLPFNAKVRKPIQVHHITRWEAQAN